MGIADTEGYFDAVSRVDYLARFVRQNGPAESELVKAFALFASKGDLDLSKGEDAEALWSLTMTALREWNKISVAEKRHILNGWQETAPPTASKFLRELAGYAENEIRWTLAGQVDPEGGVELFAENQLTHGIAAVQVAIRQGTPKAEAVAQVRAILAALESKWAEAIALDSSAALRVAAKPEAPSEPLAVGTLVEDAQAQESGVVIGGFEGVNGFLYCYATAAGDVNSQYAAGLRIAPGSRGGLPKVADLSGADPLAGRRGVVTG